MILPRGDTDKIRKAVEAILKENEGNGHFILLYCQEEDDGATTVMISTIPKDQVLEALVETAGRIAQGQADYARDDHEVKH